MPMHVTVTLNFPDGASYESWLQGQARGIQGAAPAAVVTEPDAEEPTSALTPSAVDASAPTAPEAQDEEPPAVSAPEEKASKARKPRKPRKPRAVKEVATTVIPAKPTAEPEVLPTTPASEAPPAEGERVYSLADSREVLTAYLAKEGNGAESLLKELKVHNAKRINEVPTEHVHGFLKRMVEAS